MQGYKRITRIVFFFGIFLLSACGSGGGGDGGSDDPGTPPESPSFSIQVHVSGLDSDSTGIVLQNNGKDDLKILADGEYEFNTRYAKGSTYKITVSTQPTSPYQTCRVVNGSGTITDVKTQLQILCETDRHTVGGIIVNLSGDELTLVNNGSNGRDELIVERAATTFVYTSSMQSGDSYRVVVDKQPINPRQICTASNNTGVVMDVDISDILITCMDQPDNSQANRFNSHGTVRIDVSATGLDDFAYATAIQQPDNKILVAGTLNSATSIDFALIRLNADGSLDDTFNAGDNNGVVVTDIAGAQDHVRDMVIAPDGKILVGGFAIVDREWEFALVRYDSNGKLDTSFDTDGIVTTNFGGANNYAQAITLFGDKIILAGHSNAGTLFDFAIARYLNDGSLDTSFDGDGMVLTDFFGNYDYAYDAIVQDNKLIVTGYSENGSDNDFTLLRYNDDGSIDTSFGGNGDGKVFTNITGNADYARSIVQLPTGEIVVAGYTGAASSSNIALARYNRDGILDSTFDNDGIVITDIAGTSDEAYAMTLDINGNVVVAGRTYNGTNNDDFALARYTFEGQLDTGFGINGIVTADFDGGNDEAHALAVSGDGAIIAVGQAKSGGQMDFGVLRIPLSGNPDIQYQIHVTVSGLEGSGLTLQNNGSDDLQIAADGTYVFATTQSSGSGYDVSILDQPTEPAQTCVLANQSGTVADSDVTDISVSCDTQSFLVKGTVTGLTGSGLVLQNYGSEISEDLEISADGEFSFQQAVRSGDTYNVVVAVHPVSPDQECTVAQGSGTIVDADIIDIAVTCTDIVTPPTSFTVGGSVSGLGLGTTGLVLQYSDTQEYTIISNGSFTLPTVFAEGDSYGVTIFTQPTNPWQQCTVENGSGVVQTQNISNIAINCETNTYTLEIEVTGLLGHGLRIELIDSIFRSIPINIRHDGIYTSPPLKSGKRYTVYLDSEAQPTRPSQTCTVNNPIGMITDHDITGIVISCETDSFSIAGGVVGLGSGELILQNNGTTYSDNKTISANGPFVFDTLVQSGALYNIVVSQQPDGQVCEVRNGTGRVKDTSIENVYVICEDIPPPPSFFIGGSVSGVVASGLVLQMTYNNGIEDLAITHNGYFHFATRLESTQSYEVAILSEPTTPAQNCTIANNIGTVTGAYVSDISVNCETEPRPLEVTVNGYYRPDLSLPVQWLTLGNNGGDELVIMSDGTSEFSLPIPDGQSYDVSILKQPLHGETHHAQRCRVENGQGEMVAGHIPNVQIFCEDLIASLEIVAGANHTCVTQDPDKVFSYSMKCWGFNASGQLGLGDDETRGLLPGTMGNQLPFINIQSGQSVYKMAAGKRHTCAILLPEARVKCWGWNDRGQLGLGDTGNRGDNAAEMGDNLPYIDLGPGANGEGHVSVADIAAGDYHTCAIIGQGEVKCWGYNNHGQLGQGHDNTRGDNEMEMGRYLTPVDLGTGRYATQLAAGEYHTCALLDNGEVKCWGRNHVGQLGQGHYNSIGDDFDEMGALDAIHLGTGRTAKQISVGLSFSCALLDNDQVKCWGANYAGQLGQGDTDDRGNEPGEMANNLQPIDLGDGVSVRSISAGVSHVCAILFSNKIKCWGSNINGRIGLGNQHYFGTRPEHMGNNLPFLHLGQGRTALRVAAGTSHTCAILDNDQVKCWGENRYGTLGLAEDWENLGYESIGNDDGEMGDSLPYINLGTY